ncbi:hypothetical protein IX317_001346 [Fusobacterium sp. DD29]|uniref:MerR family transcriptional regulator n=1 Tax=unclassified Fusobacterium TaxID=2648384 RepID=UPI001B8C6B84|nr:MULTISPECIES: MerR family transcriptional regulator [unclassified Fusobacterium]MBR8701962.1 hypothetical protein [Fusobacterium sp. DD45]MBR8711773.1 hypothetical protein [Fusobacterium sp. DD28]MBR8749671.1 hypothetical protein [Fusobacterium sp. DD29]MBR8752335.1 hypothetical protein [Fusobacterium sp. DD26]MBR8761932.1 hypothetical protein [Fusobacterium sp. DD25]
MEKYYSIGQVSKSCNITVKTLRYYDKIKLVQPSYRDENTNYRYYTKNQMTSLLLIRRLRAMDFSINDIREIISTPSLDNFVDIIKKNNNDLNNQINILKAKKAAGDVILNRILNGKKIIENNNNSINIKLEEIKPSLMIYSRKVMTKYCNAEVSLQRWMDIYEKCTENGVSMTSSTIVTYYAKPLEQFLMKDCDVEFGVLIESDQIVPKDTGHIREYGGYLACTAYHIGDYSEIINCHVSLLQWINKHGYEVAGPISEEFIISPLDIEYSEKHITKVIIPITLVSK